MTIPMIAAQQAKAFERVDCLVFCLEGVADHFGVALGTNKTVSNPQWGQGALQPAWI